MPRLHGYRDFAEQLREESLRRLRDTEGPLLDALRRAASREPVAITLASPRRVTSTAIAKVINPRLFAFLLTEWVFGFSASVWSLCIAAPILIFVWWRVTGDTILAAAKLDEHPIPPARVLSEGPR